MVDLAQLLAKTANTHYSNHNEVSGVYVETVKWIHNCVDAIIAVGDAFYGLNDKENAALYYKKADKCDKLKTQGLQIVRSCMMKEISNIKIVIINFKCNIIIHNYSLLCFQYINVFFYMYKIHI